MKSSEMMKTLINILDEKYQLLLEIKAFTWQQTQAITESDLDLLNELLAKKQDKIDSINKLDISFEETFDNLKSALNIESIAQIHDCNKTEAARLKEGVEKVMSIINDLKVQEQENQNKAKRLLNAFGDGIKRIKEGKKLNTAYNPSPLQYPSYFFDKKK